VKGPRYVLPDFLKGTRWSGGWKGRPELVRLCTVSSPKQSGQGERLAERKSASATEIDLGLKQDHWQSSATTLLRREVN
jgi:hypothetical protein